LSADPIGAAAWYHEHLGLQVVGKQEQKRIYNGFQVAPSATIQAITSASLSSRGVCAYAVARAVVVPKGFAGTAGRVIDHIAFAREGGKTEFIEGPDHVRIELWGEHSK
jgi:hypothetical protein